MFGSFFAKRRKSARGIYRGVKDVAHTADFLFGKHVREPSVIAPGKAKILGKQVSVEYKTYVGRGFGLCYTALYVADSERTRAFLRQYGYFAVFLQKSIGDIVYIEKALNAALIKEFRKVDLGFFEVFGKKFSVINKSKASSAYNAAGTE